MAKIVKIKTWKDMEAEFGITDDTTGTIDCKAYFIVEMEEELPADRIIEIKEGKHRYDWNGWEISDDMIEKIIEK